MILFLFVSLVGVVSASQDPAMNDTTLMKTSNEISSSLSSDGGVDKLGVTEDEEILKADWVVSGNTFTDIQTAINNASNGDTIYLGGKTFTASGSTINVNKNVIICGGTSANPDSVSTLTGNGNNNVMFTLSASGIILKNINFINSNGDSAVGAISIQASDCTISDCSFDYCKAQNGGAIYGSSSASNTKIDNCNFTNNEGKWYGNGGAIYLEGTSCEIRNSIFESNSAGHYGAIYSKGSTTVENCKFNSNSAQDNTNGAIYSLGVTNVNNCNFTQNNGGIIYSGSNSEIKNCNFESNTAQGNPVTVTSLGTTTVDNCNFTNNQAGGIYSIGNAEISNSNFHNLNGGSYNKHNFGAIYCEGSTNVDNCDFENNQVPYNDGYGGVYSNGETTVSNSNFTSNGGGAIFSTSNAELINCNIENHETGHAAVIILGSATVRSSNFTNNKGSDSNGGALSVNGVNSLIDGCNFIANEVTKNYLSGGAIAIVGSGSTISNSNFERNKAGQGGAIEIATAGINIDNCNFTENEATNGGAIEVYNDNATISNSNFNENTATSQGGAIYIADDCHRADMSFCNFTDNTATTGKAIYAAGTGNGKVTNCSLGGVSDLSVTGGYPKLTFTLQTDYTNIVVGNIEGASGEGGSIVPLPNEEIEVIIRDKNGVQVDTVSGVTDSKGQITYDYSHLPKDSYTYTATYLDGKTKEGTFGIITVEGDGFSDIQAAIDSAQAGDTIFLKNITYLNDIQGNMVINKPLAIVGVDGTVLNAEGLSGIFTVDHTNNVNFDNIKFINGNNTDYGGAIDIQGSSNGAVTNCTFVNNTANIGGGAVRVYNDAAGWDFYNSTFINNMR